MNQQPPRVQYRGQTYVLAVAPPPVPDALQNAKFVAADTNVLDHEAVELVRALQARDPRRAKSHVDMLLIITKKLVTTLETLKAQV